MKKIIPPYWKQHHNIVWVRLAGYQSSSVHCSNYLTRLSARGEEESESRPSIKWSYRPCPRHTAADPGRVTFVTRDRCWSQWSPASSSSPGRPPSPPRGTWSGGTTGQNRRGGKRYQHLTLIHLAIKSTRRFVITEKSPARQESMLTKLPVPYDLCV